MGGWQSGGSTYRDKQVHTTFTIPKRRKTSPRRGKVGGSIRWDTIHDERQIDLEDYLAVLEGLADIGPVPK